MANAKRAHARRSRATKIARGKRVSVRKTARKKPKAKPHANSRTKPLPRPHGNRLVFSPALIADGKRRYEATPESLDSIALDFSASRSTLRNIAQHENWVRYVAPPRGLSRAAEIAAKAEALEAEALNDRHPEVLATDLGFTRDRKTSLPKSATADLGGEPRRIDARAVALRGSAPARLAPQGDGEGAGGGEEAPPTALGKAWNMRERIDALRNAVDEEIAAVRALRAKLKRVPHGTETAGRTSRTLADLVATLERLHRLEIGTPQHNGQDTYDDMPADPDAFREDLARRIAAFMESRPDEDDAEEAAAAPADAPR